jgi:hypothetical protein
LGRYRDRQQGGLISLLLFFLKKESRMKMIFEGYDRVVWTGFIWLRIETSGGFF